MYTLFTSSYLPRILVLGIVHVCCYVHVCMFVCENSSALYLFVLVLVCVHVHACFCICVCVCICVCLVLLVEEEREEYAIVIRSLMCLNINKF